MKLFKGSFEADCVGGVKTVKGFVTAMGEFGITKQFKKSYEVFHLPTKLRIGFTANKLSIAREFVARILSSDFDWIHLTPANGEELAKAKKIVLETKAFLGVGYY